MLIFSAMNAFKGSRQNIEHLAANNLKPSGLRPYRFHTVALINREGVMLCDKIRSSPHYIWQGNYRVEGSRAA
jgi:hypothetical protein